MKGITHFENTIKPLFQNNQDTIQIRVHDTPLYKIDKTTTEKKGHGKPLTWV